MTHKPKVIITCAITGAIHTPSMSPHLPMTPDEIIDAAVAAGDAGAAIVHLHARDPENGRPDQSAEGFARVLPFISERSDAVINITTGGNPFMRVEERVVPAALFKPEVASLNMGSINFGLYRLLERYKDSTSRGSQRCSKRRAILSSVTHSKTSNTSWPPVPTTGPGSSSSVTTS